MRFASRRGGSNSSSGRRRILGIDPGSIVTGWGIVEGAGHSLIHIAHGIIGSNRTYTQSLRLSRIHEGIQEVLRAYRPESISLERVFFARNPQSALKLGQARGVALLAAAQFDLPVHEYGASEIKMAVVGYGHATKMQVQMMVASLLSLPARAAADASDALAAAICHLHRQAFHTKIAATFANERDRGRRPRAWTRMPDETPTITHPITHRRGADDVE